MHSILPLFLIQSMSMSMPIRNRTHTNLHITLIFTLHPQTPNCDAYTPSDSSISIFSHCFFLRTKSRRESFTFVGAA